MAPTRRPFKIEPDYDRHKRAVTLRDDDIEAVPVPSPASLINADASGRLAAVRARLEAEHI